MVSHQWTEKLLDLEVHDVDEQIERVSGQPKATSDRESSPRMELRIIRANESRRDVARVIQARPWDYATREEQRLRILQAGRIRA